MLDYKVTDFELLRFFSYTSTIPAKDRIFDYDGMNHSDNWYPNIREKFDEFEYNLALYASALWKEHTGQYLDMIFRDNKTVFEIKNKVTGHIFYIGHYDLYRFIGDSCYLYDGYVYDFKTFKHTDYVNNIMSNVFGLWQKFEIK